MTRQAVPRWDPVLASLGVLTVVSGIGDAISYLGLGHVFVANMTGNVVFLGFGAAGAGQASVPASLVALVSFLLGSLAGGRLRRAERSPAHRLGSAVALQIVPLAAAAVIAITAGHTGAARYALIAVLAVAMGCRTRPCEPWASPT